MFLRNGRICVLDLVTGESVDAELKEGTSLEGISSLKIAENLAAVHGEDSLVLGTGLLTGSFVPAGCAGIVRAKSKVAPFMGFAGSELKLSGYDFIVLRGAAKEPSYVWARDGVVELAGARQLKGTDSWNRTARIRSEQGDNKIQVVTTGPWGDAGSAASQLVLNHWGGEDKVGMGAELGRRNIVAVAFRGMGELELSEPEGHFEESILLMREQIERLGPNSGLASYWEGASRADFGKLLHRHIGCYGCPFPCRSFLKVREPPTEMRLVVNDPGYLHYDVPALEKAFSVGLNSGEATEAMISCAKAGAEPGFVLSEASKSGTRPTPEIISAVLSSVESAGGYKAGGNFERSFENAKDYDFCLGLGLCPRYWSKAGLDLAVILPLIESATGNKMG